MEAVYGAIVIEDTFHLPITQIAVLPQKKRGEMFNRVCPRFFDQVGHETMYASIENKHFSLNPVIVRPTKIMNRADNNWAQF